MFRYLLAVLVGIVAVRAVAEDQKWIVQTQCDSFSLLCDYLVDADEIHESLSDLAHELQDTLGVTPAGQPVQIVLFQSRSRYLDYLGSSVPASRHRRAVFVRKGVLTSIYCYRSNALLTDIRHEMTHAILHQYLPFLPLWMDEGLAEYFEETPEQRLHSSRTKNVRWKSAVGWSPDLERLERISVAGEMDSTDYHECWALCCYLLNESQESRSALRSFLQQIHDGHAPPQFIHSLKAEESDWQARSRAYFRKPVFRVTAGHSNLR